jgi:hypothetical protein
MRMLELRIGDPWILRLIRKWLTAGILEQGTVTTPEEGRSAKLWAQAA